MIKKIILGLITLMVIAGGALFLINGKDTYDASRYEATATDGINLNSTLSFKLPDQFDKAHTLTDETQKVIFVFAKATGHTVKTFLNAQAGDYLSQRKALFVADISPMPTVIRNTFALPDLRKSPYAVLLIYDKEIAKTFKNESQADKIAVVTLEKRKVKEVNYVVTEEALKDALN